MVSSEKMMKRVVLGILAGAEAGNYSMTPDSVCLEFIYGTASGGLTPLERGIADLELGSSKVFRVAGDDLRSFFGCHYRQLEHHLYLSIMPQSVHLCLTLTHCEDVDPREVVKAISSSLGGGCASGDCGCGCG